MAEEIYSRKIYKKKGEKVSEVERKVAQAFVEMELKTDMAAELRDIFISSAKELEVPELNKKVMVIFIPFRFHKRFLKIQSRCVRELEKKWNTHSVCFLAQRTIMSKNHSRKHKGELRPQSRTLTAVHNAILNDIVYPTQIVGKRIRVRLDGSKLIKVYLDPKDVKEVDQDHLQTFAAVYRKLTHKHVEFLFPIEA